MCLGERKSSYCNLSTSLRDRHLLMNIPKTVVITTVLMTMYHASIISGVSDIDIRVKSTNQLHKSTALLYNKNTSQTEKIQHQVTQKESANEHFRQRVNTDKDGTLQDKQNVCNLSVTTESAEMFLQNLEFYRPNFVKLKLKYRNVGVNFTSDIIQPHNWVWTYNSHKESIPFLSMPVDFSILSFGLLNSRTIGSDKSVELIIQSDKYCNLTVGKFSTTEKIGQALGHMTSQYLFKKNQHYINTHIFYCYLSEVPSVKNTVSYKISIYLHSPLDFARYNCCMINFNRSSDSNASIRCLKQQMGTLFQATVMPYIMAVLVFSYFPYFLANASALIIEKDDSCTDVSSGHHETECSKWVFLDGNPPLSIFKLSAGFCGLVRKYPYAVSRLRRTIFVLLSPALIYIRIYVYSKYEYTETMALLKHGCPMGYLSMISGIETSRDNFLPYFGGPYILMMIYYIAGVLFIILPSSYNNVCHDGLLETITYGHISPIFYSLATIERLSSVSIKKQFGYRRAASILKAEIYMLTNYKFYLETFTLQYNRFKSIYVMCYVKSRILANIFLLLILPPYFALCLFEIVISILFYGSPLINSIIFIVRGFSVAQSRFLGIQNIQNRNRRRVFIHCVKIACKVATACLFILFLFSFYSIFIASFLFVAEMLSLSFIAVIYYPSISFGYFFFGLIVMYYIMKLFQRFGSDYLTLLTDAVDISIGSGNNTLQTQIVDDTLIINNHNGISISKLKIKDHIINLETDERLDLRNMCTDEIPKVRYLNHTIGIPRDLFDHLVQIYRPIHIQVTKAILKLCLTLTFIAVTLSVLPKDSLAGSENISGIMHVIFTIGIGALPKVLEVTLDNEDYVVKKEIQMRKMRATIHEYWYKMNEQMLHLQIQS